MPIAVTCPHCSKYYPAIPDEFAGRAVRCKACREMFPIPKAIKAEDVEAAALRALSEEAAPDRPPAGDITPAPGAERTIPVVCPTCDHKWTEPFAKRGKNTVCPECRARVKVPEPQEDVPTDWRAQKTKLPSLAKQHFEKLEGVQDAGEARVVSGGALRHAGADGIDYEPRPLGRVIALGLAAAAAVVLVVGGGIYLLRSGKASGDQKLMADALKELAEAPDGERPPPAEEPLFEAALHMAAAEYALRLNTPAGFKEAQDRFATARDRLSLSGVKDDKARAAVSQLTRQAMTGELAVALLSLAGSDEQVVENVRCRWTPDQPVGRQLRVNEKTTSVHGELRPTLELLRTADPDIKAAVARRLTRELVKKGRPDLAEAIPGFLFTELEQAEAKGVVGLAAYHADKTSGLPRQMAVELKDLFAGAGARGEAPSAYALFAVTGLEGAPKGGPTAPTATGDVPRLTRLVYVAQWLAQDKADEAIALAARGDKSLPEERVRALVLCGEYAADPSAALDRAADFALLAKAAPGAVFRLSQLAAAAGKPDAAKKLADALADDGLKAWAKGDAVRLRLGPGNREPADEGWVEVPADAAKVRAGQAWGRLAVARHNAMLSGDRDAAKGLSPTTWPKGSIHPFGLAGVALGLQDR